jgi:hypothetical protein
MYYTRSFSNNINNLQQNIDKYLESKMNKLINQNKLDKKSLNNKSHSKADINNNINKFEKLVFVFIKYNFFINEFVLNFSNYIINNYLYVDNNMLNRMIKILKKFDDKKINECLYEIALLKVFIK